MSRQGEDEIYKSAEEKIKDKIRFEILKNEQDTHAFCEKVPFLNEETFRFICAEYGYPISIVREFKYIDKLYRDAYYIYLSHLHFDMERFCERLALFRGEYKFEHFFDAEYHNDLQEDFLGTVVIRPTYNYSEENTFGRTLLNPYKLKYPYRYIRTARFKVTVCGQTYLISAFPFSNQHSDLLRCAEISIWELMEYYGNRYENYSTILPSDILEWASQKLPARSIPSEGLSYRQMAGLLKHFGFEPLIYETSAYSQNLQAPKPEFLPCFPEDTTEEKDVITKIKEIEIKMEQTAKTMDAKIYEKVEKKKDKAADEIDAKGELRDVSFHNLFHYYIESGIPLVVAISNDDGIRHSIVVIGHDECAPGKLTMQNLEKESFNYGGTHFIDSSSFYERYITIDDNQYPYRSEKYDCFSIAQNCKAEAFIVPLYRHILLDAESAVSIIETIFKENSELLRVSVQQLREEIEGEEYRDNSFDNPIVLRYYLTTSRGFVDFRNQHTMYLEEKLFYSTMALPKFVWVGEYTTLELYRENKILGEIVVDATAPKYSAIGAIIAMRFAGYCISRGPEESPEVLRARLKNLKERQGSVIYDLYTNNLQKGDFKKC